MANRVPESDAVFRDVLAGYAGSPAIEVKRMFGSDALCVDGKIACFVSGSGRLVAKLPEETSARLTRVGLAEPMALGGRKPMRGWFSVALSEDVDWFALADEAVEHVHALERDKADGA
jgi:hypothetical protein